MNLYKIVLLLIGISFFSCTSYKHIDVRTNVEGCIDEKDIRMMKRNRIVSKKKYHKLFVNAIEFREEKCVGLLRYEFSKYLVSAGTSNYVLRYDNVFHISSRKGNKKDERKLDKFFELYGDLFSENERAYIEVLFLGDGVRGNFIY